MSISKNSTITSIRTANRKGFGMLDTAHKIVFVAWQQGFMNEIGRTVSSMKRDQHFAVYTKLAEIYRLQQSTNVDSKFADKTSPWLSRVRSRAAAIREASSEVKSLISNSAPYAQIAAAKNRVKAAIASR